MTRQLCDYACQSILKSFHWWLWKLRNRWSSVMSCFSSWFGCYNFYFIILWMGNVLQLISHLLSIFHGFKLRDMLSVYDIKFVFHAFSFGLCEGFLFYLICYLAYNSHSCDSSMLCIVPVIHRVLWLFLYTSQWWGFSASLVAWYIQCCYGNCCYGNGISLVPCGGIMLPW